MNIAEQLNLLLNIKESIKSEIFCTDNFGNSTHTKEMSILHITDFAQYHKVYANPVMTSDSMNGWTASANRANLVFEEYKGFNKDLSSDNCLWTGTGLSFPCWISLSFDTLYKIRSVEIMNETATPENFRNALIQFRTSEDED